MSDEDHVVGIPRPEGCETVAHDGEEGDENVVNYVDDIELFSADVDPT